MTNLVRIDKEIITVASFVDVLRLTRRFDSLIDEIVSERLTVIVAKKSGIAVTPEEIQERADQLRRVNGLHRAADMHRYLEQLKISLDAYQQFITDMLYYEKMMAQVVSDDAVEKYFKMNSPKFDSIEVSHIVVEAHGQAKEIVATLEDAPELFGELAREHSIADTRDDGGAIGKVFRGALQGDIEAKVFHAKPGRVLGPFPSADGTCFEIFMVNSKNSASFDETAKTEIRRVIKEEWLAARQREYRIEML